MNEEIMNSLCNHPTPEQTIKVSNIGSSVLPNTFLRRQQLIGFLWQSLSYFEELKMSESGWKLCMEALASNAYISKEQAQFFCFLVIESYVKLRYNQDAAGNQEILRNFIRMWPKIQVAIRNSNFFLLSS